MPPRRDGHHEHERRADSGEWAPTREEQSEAETAALRKENAALRKDNATLATGRDIPRRATKSFGAEMNR
ncbi:hypothetical protein [Streptomyces hirsutus]|uniref:hypothetical protein n=1 Tax=Streptomyces hirsutus TaxID=35620 RepID=UPI003677A77C